MAQARRCLSSVCCFHRGAIRSLPPMPADISTASPARPRSARRWLFRLVALVAAAGVSLGLIETLAALRLVDYRVVFSTYGSKAWENPSNRLDPELMHVHRAHDHYNGRLPGDLVAWLGIRTDRLYDYDVKYDRNGFRNDRDLDAADIVLIGDSFVEGAIVPYDSIASSRLARLFDVPVLNLGQSGYGPQ